MLRKSNQNRRRTATVRKSNLQAHSFDALYGSVRADADRQFFESSHGRSEPRGTALPEVCSARRAAGLPCGFSALR